MRKSLLALAAIGLLTVVGVPAIANSATAAKPTGEHCVQRVQSSKLSDAGKTIAVAACKTRAAAIADARGALREARKTHRARAKAARMAFRQAVNAAASKPEAERKAAVAQARMVRKAALTAARQDLRAARKAHRAAVKAARQAFRHAMQQARSA